MWGRVPCKDRNGEITGYVERLYLSSDTGNRPEFNMMITSNTDYNASGLIPRMSYTLEVKAVQLTDDQLLNGPVAAVNGTTAVSPGIILLKYL